MQTLKRKHWERDPQKVLRNTKRHVGRLHKDPGTLYTAQCTLQCTQCTLYSYIVLYYRWFWGFQKLLRTPKTIANALNNIILWYESILKNQQNVSKKHNFLLKCWRAKIHENPWIFMIFQNAFISSNNVIQGICKCFGSSEKLLEASKPIFKLLWRKIDIWKSSSMAMKISNKGEVDAEGRKLPLQSESFRAQVTCLSSLLGRFQKSQLILGS